MKTDEAAYANLVTDLSVYFELRPDVVLMEIRSSEQAYRRIRAAVANHTIPESVVLNAANRVIQLKQELAIG